MIEEEGFTPVQAVDEARAAMRLFAAAEVPAYLRRAWAVEQAAQDLAADCRRRSELLTAELRRRLADLALAVKGWADLESHLVEGQYQLIEAAAKALDLGARFGGLADWPPWWLRRQLRKVVAHARRYNQEWPAVVEKLDLSAANTARERFNDYYIIEKECALKSSAVARQGFVPLPPLTREDVLRWFPVLEMPRVK